jgi:hypothetical protein
LPTESCPSPPSNFEALHFVPVYGPQFETVTQQLQQQLAMSPDSNQHHGDSHQLLCIGRAPLVAANGVPAAATAPGWVAETHVDPTAEELFLTAKVNMPPFAGPDLGAADLFEAHLSDCRHQLQNPALHSGSELALLERSQQLLLHQLHELRQQLQHQPGHHSGQNVPDQLAQHSLQLPFNSEWQQLLLFFQQEQQTASSLRLADAQIGTQQSQQHFNEARHKGTHVSTSAIELLDDEEDSLAILCMDDSFIVQQQQQCT